MNTPSKVLCTIACVGFFAGVILLSPRMSTSVSAFGSAGVGKIDGDVDSSFLNGLTGTNGIVEAVAIQPDGKIIIGGQFETVNGLSRRGIARLNSDGSLDTNFQTELGGGLVRPSDIEIQPDGRIIIGGSFSSVNGITRNRIARLNSDGTLDTSFLNSSSGPNGPVFAIATQPDGKILIGGDFGIVNDNSQINLARLNADGTLDMSFPDVFDNTAGWVHGITIHQDGKALVSGWFMTVNGTNRRHIARINSDGSTDATFLGATPSSAIDDFVEQPDGRIIIGGQFSSVNGIPRQGVARLNADGTIDNTFLLGLSGANGGITRTVAVQTDGKILVGGHFQSVNSSSRRYLARLNSDGSVDASFLDGLSGPNASVEAMALQPDGRIIIGGQFFMVNGVSRNRVARLLNRAGNLPPHAGFTISSGANGELSAIEGQNLVITARTGPVLVSFSGDRSFDSDGTITNWDWTIDGVPASSNQSFTYALNHGIHTVSLRVTDNTGAISSLATSQVTLRSSTVCSVTDNSSVASDTRLVENDSTPLGGRTPLILIHGIHGNKPPFGFDDIEHPYPLYFHRLISFLRNNHQFRDRYKIYTYHWVSDKHYAEEIAASLGNKIDSNACQDPNFDKRILLIAHSTGGLVARSYMNRYVHRVGNFVNRLGGSRVSQLITLATPHHGTLGALSPSRDEIATRFPFGWETALDISSLVYWKARWRNIIYLKPTRLHFEPNRSDLRWDNYDGVASESNDDINVWLRDLNQAEIFASKITAYYGYITLDDPVRRSLVESFGVETNFPNFAVLFSSAYDSSLENDESRLCQIASIVIDYGMRRKYSLNDGLVPTGSGSFENANVRRVECRGYDHREMRDGSVKKCEGNLDLFASIEQDIMAIP